jgi:hypothetical protein
MTSIARPANPPTSMPQGVTFRPFDPEADFAAAAELITTCHVRDGIDWVPAAEPLERSGG